MRLARGRCASCRSTSSSSSRGAGSRRRHFQPMKSSSSSPPRRRRRVAPGNRRRRAAGHASSSATTVVAACPRRTQSPKRTPKPWPRAVVCRISGDGRARGVWLAYVAMRPLMAVPRAKPTGLDRLSPRWTGWPSSRRRRRAGARVVRRLDAVVCSPRRTGRRPPSAPWIAALPMAAALWPPAPGHVRRAVCARPVVPCSAIAAWTVPPSPVPPSARAMDMGPSVRPVGQARPTTLTPGQGYWIDFFRRRPADYGFQHVHERFGRRGSHTN